MMTTKNLRLDTIPFKIWANGKASQNVVLTEWSGGFVWFGLVWSGLVFRFSCHSTCINHKSLFCDERDMMTTKNLPPDKIRCKKLVIPEWPSGSGLVVWSNLVFRFRCSSICINDESLSHN